MRTFRVRVENALGAESAENVMADTVSFTVGGDLVFEIDSNLIASFNKGNWISVRDISREQ